MQQSERFETGQGGLIKRGRLQYFWNVDIGSLWKGDVTQARQDAEFELEIFTCLLFPFLFHYATGLLFRRRLINKDISSIINFPAQPASGLVRPPTVLHAGVFYIFENYCPLQYKG